MDDYLENNNSNKSTTSNTIINKKNTSISKSTSSIDKKSTKLNVDNTKNDKNDNDEIENALNEYYKLKSKYENENYIHKKSIMNNQDLSKREKQREFQRLKPKCIHCKRVGGTIFTNTRKEDAHSLRILKAICGVHENPCNLKLVIEMSGYNLYPNVVAELEDKIKECKQKIINYKNNVLFGYSSQEEALNNFTELKEDISDYMDMYYYYLDEYNNIVDNKETNEQLEKNKSTIQLFISDIKNAIVEFNKSNNEQFITDALNIYVNKLMPLTKETMHLKYKENLVIYDSKDKVYNLIQNKYSIKDIEFKLYDNKIITNEAELTPQNIINESSIEESEY
jgi:hypothetical protein